MKRCFLVALLVCGLSLIVAPVQATDIAANTAADTQDNADTAEQTAPQPSEEASSAEQAASETAPLTLSGPAQAVKLAFQEVAAGKLVVSARDTADEPIMGLGLADFQLRQGGRQAKILSVEPLETDMDIPLNIVLVVDNSFSMKQRGAVAPLLEALEAFYKTVRPIDNIHAVVFDEDKTMDVGGQALRLNSFNSANVDDLRTFFQNSFEKGLTNGTYLYDGVAAGLEIARSMPAKENKFLVVFSDGKDLNSQVKPESLIGEAGPIENLTAYTVDFTPATTTDPFLERFASTAGGRTWKAASASELVPIFEAFSTTILHRYVVTYRFLHAPEGFLGLTPNQVTIEEITTLDSAPLLNHIYFEEDQSDLPQKYTLLPDLAATESFDDTQLRGVMEKYRNVLNIIGKRLRANPEATITLVGCNANVGPEKGREDLSKSRAEAVRAYLRYIWSIPAERIAVEARNLPAAPSTSRNPEGQAENRRVEILSDHPAILDTVQSTYFQAVTDTEKILLKPDVSAEAGINVWQVALYGDETQIGVQEGQGDPPAEIPFEVDAIGLDKLAGFQTLAARMTITDKEGKTLEKESGDLVEVRYVQRKQQLAERKGYKVREKYALILFDYDSDEIKDRNQIIMNRIIKRLEQFPQAQVTITGHTDNIGKDDYNLALSDRRALVVNDQIALAGAAAPGKVSYSGAGPFAPLYDNALPEGRALNRTVTVALEYDAPE
jgi:outer membrane protein OmpA-like peptidoglycan-associated protein/Mg-chelatase subunit ChlD